LLIRCKSVGRTKQGRGSTTS